jgi:hypothetical protein
LDHCIGGALEDKFSCIAVAVVADDAFLPVPVEQFDLGPQGMKLCGADAGAEEFGEQSEVEREPQEVLQGRWCRGDERRKRW